MGSNRGTPSTDAVRSLLTPSRLRSYVDATPDLRRALTLYEWNMRASAGVMELVGVVEVVTRNALDRELIAWVRKRHPNSTWFDQVSLDAQGRNDLVKARGRATRNGRRPEVHGRVVAELTFGFWRYLVESRYLTTLWIPVLHAAFPHGPHDLLTRQREVRARLQQLHFVRNRAAHHEPIHTRDLDRDHDYAVELLGWIHPAAAAWAQDVTSLRAVLGARPSA
ncbi:hypothetical protein BIU98_08200 [Curtobacterium sp. MMLR14_010]|uniref:hypothetical protein n=1 Tax=Curtobacterium sp. MMLR14_010 TaxID=1898743 RepID=UPI0008DE6546|nr:hypothetical protein [Curtobacterium sp. MMLR14_010]OII31726.1 hypothetical protein BIU98_08200 [Curtobacterium sp. MMLR14_010]